MRYEYASYIMTVLCFIFAALLLVGYTQSIEVTMGDQLTYLVLIMLSTMLGLIFAVLGYITRTRRIKPYELPSRIPSLPPKPPEAKPKKKVKKMKPAQIQLKLKLSLTNIASLAMLGTGIIALIASLMFSSSILAFVGLGLTFWGATFLYIRTEKSIKEALLDKTTFPSLLTLNQMIAELGFKGQAVYLPPEYLKDFESSKVFVAKQERKKPPTPNQLQNEGETLFTASPEGVLLTPPGADLTRLFENTLGITFTKVDLPYLAANMPKLIVEDLEIAENFEMQTKESRVYVKMENSIYRNMHLEAMKHPQVKVSMGCPICSAIACAIAKAAGKPVVIGGDQISEDGRTITIEYRLL